MKNIEGNDKNLMEMELNTNNNAISDGSVLVDVHFNENNNWTAESLHNGKFPRI